MTDYVVLQRIRLGAAHVPTGKTRHYHGDTLLPPPVELQIVQYPGDLGYYLFYMDDSGEEQTDTWHETPEGAMNQADFEFGVKPEEWVVVSDEGVR